MRTIGFAILLTGAIAGLASIVEAQSAGWILWEKNYTTKGTTETTTWEPLDGFDLLAECRMTAREIFQTALAYMKNNGGKLLGDVRTDGRSGVFAVTQAGVEQTVDIRYLCFPGAFDPRPLRP
jgi:hypothetical protein